MGESQQIKIMPPLTAHKPAHLRLIADLPFLQHTSVFLSLMVKLGLEKCVLIPQLVVLRPVLLRLLEERTWKLAALSFTKALKDL